MSQILTNTIKTITGTCGGKGSWLSNPLSNAGPGSGSIKSLFPYSASLPPPSSFEFPGILQSGGGTRRIRRIRRKSRRTRTSRHTNKNRRKYIRKH